MTIVLRGDIQDKTKMIYLLPFDYLKINQCQIYTNNCMRSRKYLFK